MLFVLLLWDSDLVPRQFLIFLFLISLGAFISLFLSGRIRRRNSQENLDDEDDGPGGDEITFGTTQQLSSMISDVFKVSGTSSGRNVIIFEGTLKMESKAAYDRLSERFKSSEYVPFLYQENDKVYLKALHRSLAGRGASRQTRPLINLLLFLATIITTTFMGAALFQGIDVLREPLRITAGLPYSLTLLAILGAHELGHYFTARYYGIQVTLPFFIPVPFFLGTLGAFIQMRSLVKDKKALFDVGIAGPLAGLFIAIPALIIGIQNSKIITGPLSSGGGMTISQSILLNLIEQIALGRVTGEDATIILNPMAFAGWIGLIVTALNLIPIGQLDGGHISYSLFGGRRSQIIAFAAFAALIFRGIYSQIYQPNELQPPWFVWAIVIFFLVGFRRVPVLNDIPSLDTKRLLLGGLAFLLLFLIIAPPINLF